MRKVVSILPSFVFTKGCAPALFNGLVMSSGMHMFFACFDEPLACSNLKRSVWFCFHRFSSLAPLRH
jgi:hypothetical protein